MIEAMSVIDVNMLPYSSFFPAELLGTEAPEWKKKAQLTFTNIITLAVYSYIVQHFFRHWK